MKKIVFIINMILLVNMMAYAQGKYGGGDGSGYGSQTISNINLPVELLHFSAHLDGQGMVDVHWITATESNNAGFYLQRSADGTEWGNLDFIQGKGNSSENIVYDYTDGNPLKGLSFYRLQQMDFDGTFTFSDIVSVHIEFDTKFEIYPTIASSILNVQLEAKQIEREISIYNFEGKKVYSIRNSGNEGIMEIDISNIPSGIYLLSIQFGNKIFSKRFFKMDE